MFHLDESWYLTCGGVITFEVVLRVVMCKDVYLTKG